MIIDEILYAERFFRERHRAESPKRITLCEEYYIQLCEELGVEDLDTFHGMTIEVVDDVETFLIEGYEVFLDLDDEYEEM